AARPRAAAHAMGRRKEKTMKHSIILNIECILLKTKTVKKPHFELRYFHIWNNKKFMTSNTLYANDLILFAHIVEAGSFTGASERTGLPKSTLSRRLTDLENELGERLLQRSTRRLVLTEFGERILEYARRLQEETEAASALAQHRQLTPQGVLRISLPPEFYDLSFVNVLAEFTQQYPDVRLELDLSARRVDFVAARFDISVRVATL